MAGLESWRGKRAAFIGDSITEGVGSEKAYHEYLGEWLGIEALNYGVNGAQTHEMRIFARRLKAEKKTTGETTGKSTDPEKNPSPSQSQEQPEGDIRQ